MTATEEGWYSIDAPYGAGTLYRFLIDDELHVPDPVSRAQAGDVHAPSLVVDTHDNYLWRNSSWLSRPWHETVLRSEEHTSELQSLKRNSYAVFCLKKKT